MKFTLLVVLLFAMAVSALVTPSMTVGDRQDVGSSEEESSISKMSNIADEGAHAVSKRDSLSHFICKAGSDGPGSTIAFAEGIKYIASWGDAVFVVEAGPGKCKQIACSWDSAIRLCNDQDSQIQIPAKEIVPLAQKVVDECYWVPWGNPLAQGQAFSDNNWNVILGKGKC